MKRLIKTRIIHVFAVLLVAVFASVLLWGRNGKSCPYGEKVYADEAFKVNGATCQQCKDGSWFDKTKESCAASASPTSETAVKSRYDCEYNRGIYANGAYHLNGSNCQRCGSGVFVDAPTSSCSAK